MGMRSGFELNMRSDPRKLKSRQGADIKITPRKFSTFSHRKC